MSQSTTHSSDEISDRADVAVPNHRDRMAAGLAKGLVSIGTALEKMNISKLVENLETRDPELCDKPEAIKKEIEDENERNKLIEEALLRCKVDMEDHLSTFLFLNPQGSFEQWISELHPENAQDGSFLPEFKDMDRRFYVSDSDHRIMWNRRVPPDRQIAARTFKVASDAPADLLNDNFSEQAPSGDAPSNTNYKSDTDNPPNQNYRMDLLGDGWP